MIGRLTKQLLLRKKVSNSCTSIAFENQNKHFILLKNDHAKGTHNYFILQSNSWRLTKKISRKILRF